MSFTPRLFLMRNGSRPTQFGKPPKVIQISPTRLAVFREKMGQCPDFCPTLDSEIAET